MGTLRTVGSLLVSLKFDAKEVDKGLKQFEKNMKDMGRRMESVGRSMTIGFTAPFLLGIRQAIKAYDEEAQVVKKLEVALGRTSTALLNQAAALQKNTIYSDDSIISVQAWAAALGHSEAEIQKMTTAAVGLASGLGIGLDQAMSMLHKTTLGATKGLGNLVPGVKSLTAEQLKSGAAIDLVNEKFKGFAETAAKTGLGPLKVLQNQLGDMMEDVGRIAIPFVTKLAEKLKSLAEWFDKLSPAMKEGVLQFGFFVALAGPVLLMAGNIIKLATAFSGLATSLKAVATIGGGIPALLLAMAAAAYKFDQNFNPTGVMGNAQGFAGNVADWAAKKSGFLPKSSQYGSASSLIPGYSAPDNSGMLMSSLVAAIPKGGGGGGGGKRNASDFLVPDNFGTPIGMEGIMQSDFSPSGNNPITASLPMPDMKGIIGSFERALPLIDDIKSGVSGVTDSFISMGDVLSVVMGDVVKGLSEGGKSFAEYALSAVSAIAKVIQAKMMELAINIVTGEAAKGGLVGALIGLAASTAVLAGISGIMSKQKAPHLAQGGVSYGPTMAMIGDNASGKEMVMPWEKTGEFAQKIASHMGGAGGNMSASVVLRGDDLHMVVKKAQDRAVRRGSGNTITF